LSTPERQSAQMLEIKDVAQTWMTLTTFKRNYLTPLHFKWLIYHAVDITVISYCINTCE